MSRRKCHRQTEGFAIAKGFQMCSGADMGMKPEVTKPKQSRSFDTLKSTKPKLFTYPFYRGDHKICRVNFAQFFRPPLPLKGLCPQNLMMIPSWFAFRLLTRTAVRFVFQLNLCKLYWQAMKCPQGGHSLINWGYKYLNNNLIGQWQRRYLFLFPSLSQ